VNQLTFPFNFYFGISVNWDRMTTPVPPSLLARADKGIQ
jgi:hypothetical protein